MGDGVAVVDQKVIIGDRCLAVWCVPVGGSVSSFPSPPPPVQVTVSLMLSLTASVVVIPVEAGCVGACVINAQGVLAATCEGRIGQSVRHLLKSTKVTILCGT